MSSNIPFTSMPSEDPFYITSGEPSFMKKVFDAAVPAPARSNLFKSKEMDSGIVYTETPSVAKSDSTLSGSTSDVQSVVGTPESSITGVGGPATSVAQLLAAGATDQDQMVRLLTNHFRLTQLTSPKFALVFVGK